MRKITTLHALASTTYRKILQHPSFLKGAGRDVHKKFTAILLMAVILGFPGLAEAFCKKSHPGSPSRK